MSNDYTPKTRLEKILFGRQIAPRNGLEKAVKYALENGGGGGGGGGGAGAMVVNMTQDESEKWQSDKTPAEIVAAFEADIPLFLKADIEMPWVMLVVNAAPNEDDYWIQAVTVGADSSGLGMISMIYWGESEGWKTGETYVDAELVKVVTLTKDDGVWTADETRANIVNSFDDEHRAVFLDIDGTRIPVVSVVEGGVQAMAASLSGTEFGVIAAICTDNDGEDAWAVYDMEWNAVYSESGFVAYGGATESLRFTKNDAITLYNALEDGRAVKLEFNSGTGIKKDIVLAMTAEKHDDNGTITYGFWCVYNGKLFAASGLSANDTVELTEV